jgi:hypothetical protein
MSSGIATKYLRDIADNLEENDELKTLAKTMAADL